MHTRRRKCQKSDSSRLLLDLPDGAVENIAGFLPPAAMAHLQCTCKHLHLLLCQDRIWQGQLNQSFPLWSSTGIYPVAGRQDGETWKQLVSTAYGMKLPEPSDNPLPATAYYDRIKELWNKGKDRVRLDFHLCYAEGRSSRWNDLSSQPYFKTETTVMLLELVYFFWFEEKQLSRGAKMLAKALGLLADLAKTPTWQTQPLWHTNADLAMAASAAGSYVIDLLQMRVAHLSPLAITSPEAFLAACSGASKGHDAAPCAMGDKFEWCGGEYDAADLKDALALLIAPDTPQDQLLAQQYSDPWASDSWQVLGNAARSLLKDLAHSQTAYNNHDDWQLPGAALLSKAEQMSEVPGELTLSGVCKAHHLFAGATLLLRMHFRQDKGVTVHAEHGLMYEDARQHQRAAYYYKQAIMVGSQTGISELDYNVDSVLVGIAEAYDGEWQDTASLRSFEQAFEWRKFLAQRLLGKADRTPALFERSCECLHSLGLLLEDHSCRGGSAPALQGCNSHLLAVGAYMTGMRQIDDNSAIIAWLHSHIHVADAAEKAFTAFLADDSARTKSGDPAAASAHLPLGAAAPSQLPTHADSSPAASLPQSSAPSPTSPNTTDQAASASPEPSPEASQAPGKPAKASSSAGAGAGQVWAKPPAELTVKHVGFLGSLAHALVHLQQAAEGLALLRTAASIMRSNPPSHPLWFHGSPDPQVLHAHVLMDLGVSLLGERQYEEALDVFMEGLVIAERQRLAERILSTFHDHVAHTILQLRQQRALHTFALSNGDRMEITWRHAEEHAKSAVGLGRRCKPPEAALEASPLTTMGDIASAMCRFPVAKERYMEAYDRLIGCEVHIEALTASNAAEAATTMAAVADMMLKMGQIEEATSCLATSLDLLKQHPGQLSALQVKRTQLYLTTLQMQICIYNGDLPGAQQQLDTCIGLTHTGAEYRPGFIRYDEAVITAAQGKADLALQHFMEATSVAQQQQDKQLETMAATAVGLLLSSPSQSMEKQEEGWKVLQRGMSLAVRVGDKLCEAHAAEGMLRVLASDGFGKKLKNKRELKRSLQEQVQVISKDIGQAAVNASRRLLSFAGL